MEEDTLVRIKKLGARTTERKDASKDKKMIEGQKYLLDLFKENVVSLEATDPWIPKKSSSLNAKVIMHTSVE